MAQFDANISILVNAQKAFAVVEKLENKLSKLQDKATKTQVGAVVRQDKQALTRSEKALENEVRLVAAKQRRSTIDKALQRAGAGQDKASAKRIADLRKVSDAGEDNLGIQNSVNAALEKELQVRREINRTDRAKAKVQRDVAGYNKRINLLGDTGQTDSALKQVRKLRDELNKLNDAGSVDLAKTVDAKLQQKLKLLERANKVTRPGSLSGGARSPVGGSTTTPGSPKFIDAQAAANTKLARELEKVAAAEQKRNQAMGGARSPISGSADTPGSPKYIEAQAKALEKLAKAGGPSSPIGGTKNIVGSPAYTKNIRNAGLALRSLAKGVDSTVKKADKVSGSKGAAGPLALPDSKTLKAATRGIQRIETSADKTQRFAERRAQALRRSEERSKSILEANQASVKAGKRNAAEAAKKAKSDKASANSIRQSTKDVKEATRATKAANKAKGKGKGQGLLGFGQTATNLSAGAGFPLLFGGGPGSVLGGVGGALLGGFGGSIIGGALGQQLDALGGSALKTAEALSKPTSNLEALINTLGIAGTKLASDLEVLQELGLGSVASAAAKNQFEALYGADAAQKFDQLNDDFKEFANGLQTLGVSISTLLAGPFGNLLKTLGRAAAGAATASTVGQLEKTLSGDELEQFRKRKAELQKSTPGAFGSTTTQPLTAADEAKLFAEFSKQTDEKTKTLDVDGQITAEMNRQLLLAQKTTAVEAGRLTNRRDTQAALASEVQVQSALNDLAKINLNLENEKEKTKRRLLELDQGLAQEQVKQAQIAQQNAVRQAELQIYKDQTNAIINTSKVENEIYQIKLKSQALNESAAQQTQTKLIAIRQEAKSQEEVLRAKFELRKLDIKELEVKIQEAMLLEAKVEKIKEELALKEKQIRQADALRIIGINQFQQQQDLNDLLAEQNALRSIQANSPERTLGFASAGLGFFGDSAKLEADLFQKYNDDIDVFNEKIKAAERNIQDLTAAEIKDGRATPFYKEIIALDNALDRYKRLQPAINAAAVEQQRFNDALAAVSPGVNALVGGLRDVIAGTKTAEQAFADFLNTVADQLIQTAATMIAQYIAIGIAKAFAFGGNSPIRGVSPKSIEGAGANMANMLMPPGRATGGTAEGGQPYIVGESGPELFIPGVTGTVTNNDQFAAAYDAMSGSGGGSSNAFSENSDAIAVSNSYTRERTLERERNDTSTSSGTMLIETQVINNVEYATVDQVDKAAAASAKQARAQVFSDMRSRPATRRSVGMK